MSQKSIDLERKIKVYNKLLLRWQLMKKDTPITRIAANSIAKRIILLENEIKR